MKWVMIWMALIWAGTAFATSDDEPLVCGDDDSTCSWVDVWMTSYEDVGGFQMTFTGPVYDVDVAGYAGDAGFDFGVSEDVVVVYSIAGIVLPPTESVPLFKALISPDTCVDDSETLFVGLTGELIASTLEDCLHVVVGTDPDLDCLGVSGGAAVMDECGVCGGTAEESLCGDCEQAGDINYDGVLNVIDIIESTNLLLVYAAVGDFYPPTFCGDMDGDDVLSIGDIVRTISTLLGTDIFSADATSADDYKVMYNSDSETLEFVNERPAHGYRFHCSADDIASGSGTLGAEFQVSTSADSVVIFNVTGALLDGSGELLINVPSDVLGCTYEVVGEDGTMHTKTVVDEALDECGVPGGDDSTCSLVDVWMTSYEDVSGFQIDFTGPLYDVDVAGYAGDAGFEFAVSDNRVLAYSMDSLVLPPTESVPLFKALISPDTCVDDSEMVFVGLTGEWHAAALEDCLHIVVGTAPPDCLGVPGGAAVVDAVGVCGGDCTADTDHDSVCDDEDLCIGDDCPDVSMTGECGGEVTLNVTGSDNFRVVYGDLGTFTVPDGAAHDCGGTTLEVDGRATPKMGADDVPRTFTLPIEYCGSAMQVIDMSTCAVSNVVTAPEPVCGDGGFYVDDPAGCFYCEDTSAWCYFCPEDTPSFDAATETCF